jgi:hypothetical protein
MSHAKAQAVSSQFLTLRDWVRSELRSYGICGGKSDTEAYYFFFTSV